MRRRWSVDRSPFFAMCSWSRSRKCSRLGASCRWSKGSFTRRPAAPARLVQSGARRSPTRGARLRGTRPPRLARPAWPPGPSSCRPSGSRAPAVPASMYSSATRVGTSSSGMCTARGRCARAKAAASRVSTGVTCPVGSSCASSAVLSAPAARGRKGSTSACHLLLVEQAGHAVGDAPLGEDHEGGDRLDAQLAREERRAAPTSMRTTLSLPAMSRANSSTTGRDLPALRRGRGGELEQDGQLALHDLRPRTRARATGTTALGPAGAAAPVPPLAPVAPGFRAGGCAPPIITWRRRARRPGGMRCAGGGAPPRDLPKLLMVVVPRAAAAAWRKISARAIPAIAETPVPAWRRASRDATVSARPSPVRGRASSR